MKKLDQDTTWGGVSGEQDALWGLQQFSLNGDNGAMLNFTGRLFSEGSFYDEDTGLLTRLKLFITDAKRLVYFVTSGAGQSKSRRMYELFVEDGVCYIDNGLQSLTLPTDMLFVAISSLCGVAPGHAAELRANLEESLKAVSAG